MAIIPPTIWITGALGFTGRHLVEHLRSIHDDATLVGLDRQQSARGVNLDVYHAIDLVNHEDLVELASRCPPHFVYHLAGVMPPGSEAEMWQVNVGGTHTLLQALRQENQHSARILSIGSAAEYLPCRNARVTETDPGGGLGPYGRSKYAQSCLALGYARAWGLQVMVARTFNLIGPGLSSNLVAGALCRQFANPHKKTVKVGQLNSLRDFVDVRDAVAAYARVCKTGEPGEAYNVCSGRATRISTLLKRISECAPTRKKVITRNQDAVAGIDRSCGDNSKLKGLGWEPAYSLTRSVRDMMEGIT